MSFAITHPNGTHINVLLKVCAAIPGPILELGVGQYSTPRLHALSDRVVLSVDDDEDWLLKFTHLLSHDHSFLLHKFPVLDRQKFGFFSVIFIDHEDKGGWRKRTLQTLRGKAIVFVIHDTEPDGNPAYQWGDSFLGWTNSYTHKAVVGPHTRWTTVLSDGVSLDFLERP